MAIEQQNATGPSTTALVGGIIDDLQDLVKQQVKLTRQEITDEVHRASEAVQLYASGGAILFVGLVLLGLGMVHFLHWVSCPPGTDVGTIPLWVCHAIVGGPLALVGAALTWFGREKLGSISPLHNPATEAFKENVKWATKKVDGATF